MNKSNVTIMVFARNNIAGTSVAEIKTVINVKTVGIGMNVRKLTAAGGIRRYLAKAQKTPSLLRDILLIWYGV